MKKKIFEYFDNSIEVNKAVVDGLLDEIIAGTAEEAYDEGYDSGFEDGYTDGYNSAYQEVAANENLKSENIRKGVNLFGVIGTYEGEPTEEPPEE